MRQSQTARRAVRTVAVLATIIGSAVAGLQGGAVSAGQGDGLVLSTMSVLPGQPFDAYFTCAPGASVAYSFQGASSTVGCGADGTARAPLAAPGELGRFVVSATVSGASLSAAVDVVSPGQPTLISSGVNQTGVPVTFGVTGCGENRVAVGRLNGQLLAQECQVGDDGLVSAYFNYAGLDRPGIYAVAAAFESGVVLDGAIYVVGDTSTEPELPVSGPAESIVAQLVAATAAVGIGASLLAWTRRRRITT